MRAAWLIAGLGVGCLGTLGIQWLQGGDEPDISAVEEVVALATATATVADLTEEAEWDGALGYRSEFTVSGSGGTVTAAPQPGTHISRGEAVIHIDAEPVVLFYGTIPPYRALSEGDSGADVQQLEANLVELGYDPDGTVSVDTEFTGYTTAMVSRWQEDVGLTVDGVVDPSDLALAEGPIAVVTATKPGVSAGGALVTAAPLDSLGVTVEVAIGEAGNWQEGQAVTVITADSSEWAAQVADVGTTPTEAPDGSATISVLVEMDSNDATELLAGSVTVRTVTDAVYGALVVPSRSLVALAEGGFAVEKVTDDGAPNLVGVTIGTFDDGLVEVVEGDLVEGDQVVVPA